jgi:hypothetical protein
MRRLALQTALAREAKAWRQGGIVSQFRETALADEAKAGRLVRPYLVCKTALAGEAKAHHRT